MPCASQTLAIFVLNVAIAADFRRQAELPTNILFLEIYRCKVVQHFTAQPLESAWEGSIRTDIDIDKSEFPIASSICFEVKGEP